MPQQGMNELESKAWRAFHKIGQQLIPHLGRQIMNHSGLSAAEYVVLLAIYESEEASLNVNTLADQLGWEISRISHQLSRMHEGGLLKKTKSSSDSRCFDICLTAVGRKRIVEAIPRQSLEINHCFSEILTKSQMQSLIEISDVISNHLEKYHPVNQKIPTQKAS